MVTVVKPGRHASRRTVTMVLLGVALLACGLQGCGKDRDRADEKPSPPPTAPRATSELFDGGRAFGLLREQVVDFGWRPAGSSALRLAVRLSA